MLSRKDGNSMKHYDSKNDILRRMREVEKVQNRADKAVAASWSAFMMLGLLTLYEDCGFREKRLNAVIEGIHKRNDQFDRGEISLNDIKKQLYEKAGVIVEQPEP